MAGSSYRPPRRARAGSHVRKVRSHQIHRRSGAHRGITKRINRKLFRGRTVNAPRVWW